MSENEDRLSYLATLALIGRMEMESMLTPEALAKLDEAEAQMIDRILGESDDV